MFNESFEDSSIFSNHVVIPKLIKFTNGEMVIAKVPCDRMSKEPSTIEETNKFAVISPLLFIVETNYVNGMVVEQSLLVEWLKCSTDFLHLIPEDTIISVANIESELVEYYNKTLYRIAQNKANPDKQPNPKDFLGDDADDDASR
jgi:hypothetical protein